MTTRECGSIRNSHKIYLYGKKEEGDKEKGQEVEGQEAPLVLPETASPQGGAVFRLFYTHPGAICFWVGNFLLKIPSVSRRRAAKTQKHIAPGHCR